MFGRASYVQQWISGEGTVSLRLWPHSGAMLRPCVGGWCKAAVESEYTAKFLSIRSTRGARLRTSLEKFQNQFPPFANFFSFCQNYESNAKFSFFWDGPSSCLGIIGIGVCRKIHPRCHRVNIGMLHFSLQGTWKVS